MKVILIVLFVTNSLWAGANLQDSKADARNAIAREIKALESSRNCINTARDMKEFKNCNYDSSEILIQKEEAKQSLNYDPI